MSPPGPPEARNLSFPPVPAPAVSVCIPAYNAARYLPETLATLRAQSVTDWELIVVEDGSDDGTEALVQAFAEGGPQPVRFHRHPQNRGLSATRNSAIAAASSPRIALLDADDLWLPHHLADLLATAEHTGAELVGASCMLFDSDSGRDLEERHPTPAAAADPAVGIFTGTWILQPSAALLDRNRWKELSGFDTAFRIADDRDMWLRCLRAGAKAAWTGRISCRYRKHPSALTRKVAELAVEAATIAERHADWAALPPGLGRRQAASAWLAAGRLQRRSNPSAARTAFRHASRLRPFWWLPRLFLLATPRG